MAVLGSPAPAFPEEGSTPTNSFDSESLVANAVRALVFIPWCVLVGGTILLLPTYLPRIASSTCAFTPPVPPPGIRRFAYWAECAFYHVFIFAAFVIALMVHDPPKGAITAFITVAVSTWRWSRFKMDDESRGVRLGEDDWQSCYLVATKVYMKEECKLITPSSALEKAASSGVGAHQVEFD